MNKEDLKYGNVVETGDGERYLFNYVIDDLFISLDNEGYLEFDDLHINDKEDYKFSIMKVYKDYTLKELLWERKEKPKLTDDEKAILRNINENYVWIARNENGMLFVFTEKPFKLEYYWKCEDEDAECYVYFFDHLFKSIKWEDEEPYLIEDLLKEDNEND